MIITSIAQEKVLDLLEGKSATEFLRSTKFSQARQIVDLTKGVRTEKRKRRLSK